MDRRAILGPLAALVAGAVLGTGAHVLAGPRSVAPGGARLPDATVLAATAQRDTAAPIGASELMSRIEAAVLRADVEACGKVRQGTVTVVDAPGGTVGLTNAHVVRGAASALLSGAGLGVNEVTVSGYLAGRDVAAVDLDPLGVPRDAPLELGPAAAVGDPVATAGFPNGSWKVQHGHVVATETRSAWGGHSAVMLIDVPAVEGTSGGVVVDSAGRAVGLIAARDPRTGYTVAYPLQQLPSLADGPVIGC